VAGGALSCPHCSREIRVQTGVVLALAGERAREVAVLAPGPGAGASPLQGWAAGMAADMDGKAATYATKYERITRASAGFLARRELALSLAGSSPGRVLEPGCGPGVISRVLAQRDVETHGVDLSAGQLRTAAANDPRTLYVQGNLMALPYRTGTFDTIILIGVLEYLERPDIVMREIARVLTAAGRFIVSVPNAASPVRMWTQYAYLPSTRLLKRLLRRPVAAYSRRLYSLHGLVRLLDGAGLRLETSRFFDVVLAGPPLDRLLADRPPRLADRLERLPEGPLRPFVSGQIIVSATPASTPAKEALADRETMA
jgi:ubiquinone/menaquinone biosynthesis C-methylase UbiE